MSKDSLTVAAVISATPRELYAAWLDSALHTQMTGGAARIEPHVGGKHTAWDGYIEGRTVELEPDARIVQTWRSSAFPADAEDSQLEITFEPHGEGARVVIVHTNIPAGQGDSYDRGWQDHYFEPMIRFFRGREPGEPEWAPDSTPETIRAPIPADEAVTLRAPAKPAKKAAKKSAPAKKLKAAAKATSKKAAKPVAKAKKAAKKPAKKAAKKPAKKAAKKATKSTAKKPAKKSAEKVARKPASAKKPAKASAKAAKKPAKAGKRGASAKRKKPRA
jgi:uncharacterized protein YndB with AHSA1/START domain